MASAQISSTIRPAYVWTGEEWVQIGDGGSGSGSVTSGFPKTSYGTASPSFVGEEEEIYYHVNVGMTELQNVYVYYEGEWRLFNFEYAWENLSQESWQWLLDNSVEEGWAWLLDAGAQVGDVDYNIRFLPNAIANILYLNKNTASTLYLTQLSASSTYVSKIEAGSTINRWSKIYSASATTISGPDGTGKPLSYISNFENLYINCILIDKSNYTSTSGSTIILSDLVSVNDVVEVLSFNTFDIANTYTQSQSDNKFLTINSASSTYLPQSDASSLYLTQSNASSTYLPKSDASSLYLTQSSASSTYLTQSSASSTYLTQSSASALYDNIEQFMTLAISDELTSITTGTNKLTMRSPYAMTLTRIPRASLNTVSSSGNPTVDINLSGTSILGVNKLSIDASEKTSTTAVTATTLATTSIPDDSEITFDIDTAGTGAKGLKVILYYKRS